jgi:hypothetical protein
MNGAIGWNSFIFKPQLGPVSAGTVVPGQGAAHPRGTLDTPPGELPPVSGHGDTFRTGAPLLPEPRQFSTLGVSGIGPRLGDFGTSAVGIQQIAQVVQEQNLQARETARQDRQAARDADIAAQQKVADEIRNAAVFALVSTVVSSGMAIAGGAVQMRGAVKAVQLQRAAMAPPPDPAKTTNTASMTSTKSGAKAIELDDFASRKPKTPPKDVATLDAERDQRLKLAEPEIRAAADKGMAGNTLLTEGGKLTGGIVNIGASGAEARKAEEQAESTKFRSMAEDETDFIRAYADNVRAVQEKLAALQQAEADTNRQIVRA